MGRILKTLFKIILIGVPFVCIVAGSVIYFVRANGLGFNSEKKRGILENCEEIQIPDLSYTDVLGDPCNCMTPQGICIAGDYILITAYCNVESLKADLENNSEHTVNQMRMEATKEHNRHNSVLYVLDRTNGNHIATMVFDSVAYKNVISNGLVLDKNGVKMSKRLGNVINPFECIAQYGTDAVRWYMITNSSPWDNLSFDPDGVKEITSSFFIKLYQAYSFFTLYANVDGFCYEEADIPFAERPDFDRWLLSELNTLVKNVDACMNDYEPTPAGRLIQNFVIDKLSNWYIRLKKKRFWGGGMTADKLSAYQTLYKCLDTLSRLIAPVSPFYADRLFLDLNDVTGLDKSESVHLAKYPLANDEQIDTALVQAMQVAMQVTSMVLSLRKKVKIPVIQALQAISIPATDAEMRQRIELMANVILAETNVKELTCIDGGAGILVKKVKCNFRTMGKKFGKMMKNVNAAVTAFTQEQIAELEQNAVISIEVEGQPVKIEIEDVEIISEDIPGWTIAQEGKFTVALDIEITPELKLEGLSRLVIKRIQALRKESGFEITDRIDVVIEDTAELHEVIKTFGDHISAQVLANTIVMGDATAGSAQDFGDFTAKVLVRKSMA